MSKRTQFVATSDTPGIHIHAGISDRRKAMTYVAMTNTNDTGYPNAPDNLWTLKKAWLDCDMMKRERLFEIVNHFFNSRYTNIDRYI